MVVGYCQPVGGVISWSSGILCLSIYIFEVKLILDLNVMLGPKYAYISWAIFNHGYHSNKVTSNSDRS
jgi:hypothetical protein